MKRSNAIDFCKWKISCENDLFRIPVGLPCHPWLASVLSRWSFYPEGVGQNILLVDTKIVVKMYIGC